MKHFSTILAVLALSALTAVGCGKKKDGATGVANVPVTCGQGQLYSSQYNTCLVQSNQCTTGQGWYSGTNTCVPGIIQGGTGYGTYPTGQYPTGAYGNYWTGNLVITDRAAYQQLLRMAGMCSRGNLFNFGDEKCKHYSRGGRVQMSVSGNIAQIAIHSGNSYGYGYAYQGAPPAAYAPIVFTVQLAMEGPYLAFSNGSFYGYFSTPQLAGNMAVEMYFGGHKLGNANLVGQGY